MKNKGNLQALGFLLLPVQQGSVGDANSQSSKLKSNKDDDNIMVMHSLDRINEGHILLARVGNSYH